MHNDEAAKYPHVDITELSACVPRKNLLAGKEIDIRGCADLFRRKHDKRTKKRQQIDANKAEAVKES